MHSRRDTRPPNGTVGGQQLPEMHVSMKVNIVSDGPGGISFSQAVNTPSNYNGLYDFSHLPTEQNQYSLGPPDSNMLPWPNEAQKDTPTEPVVQMPTDTSQENILDNTTNVATLAVPTVDKIGDKKKHRHHRHKHREKKEGDDESVTRSQSASSMTTSLKISDVTSEKKHRRPKQKSGGDESSSTSKKSNGERSSSAHASHRRKPEPAERRSVHPVLGNGGPAITKFSRDPDPVIIAQNRKLDELLSEVVINTFADEEIGRDRRLASPKTGMTITFQEQSSEIRRSMTRFAEEDDDGIRVRPTETIAGQRFMKGGLDRVRYPVPVDTPIAPKVTISQATQPHEPFQSDRGIQTDTEDKQEKKKRDKKPKMASEVPEAAPVHDYLRHIAEATAGLIEASRVVLEQRAQTPQLYMAPEPEPEVISVPHQQMRVPKETLIDDPAIPPLSPDSASPYRPTSGLDSSYERRGRSTPGLDSRGGQTGRMTPGIETHLNTSKGNGAGAGASVGNGSFERSCHPHQHQYPQEEESVYYMHTYCAICGSPRITRKAVSGGTISPNQEYLQQTRPDAQNKEHFLVHTRPSGVDEIQQTSPPRRPQQPPPQPPQPPQIFLLPKQTNGDKIEQQKVVKEADDLGYLPNDHPESHQPTDAIFSAMGNRRSVLKTTLDEILPQPDSKPPQCESPEPPQPLPKDYMDHNKAHNGNGDPRLFSLAEDFGVASKGPRDESGEFKKPQMDITAEARARLREMQLLSCDTSPRVQIGRPLQMFSPSSSVVTRSTETSIDQSTRSDIPHFQAKESVISPISLLPRSEKIPNGHSVVDRPTPEMDFRTALEQRRQELAKKRETFFGPVQPHRSFDDPELRAIYERNSVYVPPVAEQQSKLNVMMETEEKSAENDENTVVHYEEQVETVLEEETVESTVKYERIDHLDESRESEESGHSLPTHSYTPQSYADFVAQKRLMPSAKIFQLHTKPSSSVSSGSVSDYGKRPLDILEPSNMSVTSIDTETSFSRRAMAGSGSRLDDGISSVGSIPRTEDSRPEYGQPDDDEVTLKEESVPNITSYRSDQTRMAYQGDTLSSTTSGASSQAQKRANDLYRKALLSQQQGRKEISSRTSSINSERSSVSFILRERAGGAYTTTDIDRYMEDNASDYSQDRLTPLDDEWAMGGGSRGSETGTRSHDSLASETSYRADASHDFYSVSDRPNQRSPVELFRPSRHNPPVSVAEKSFADIMRERSAARNNRLAYFSNFGQQPPPLDRIEELDQEGSLSKGRRSSTVTTGSDHTMTGTDSIDREGSGIYAIRPSAGKIHKSALLTAAMLGGSSSLVGSELENIDDYSQGRISPMMDIGNDRAGTLSSYATLTIDSIRMAELISREPPSELNEPGFVGYGKGAERVLASNRQEINSRSSSETPSSTDGYVERKRFRQTDL